MRRAWIILTAIVALVLGIIATSLAADDTPQARAEGPVPPGMVAFFASKACPAGWTAYAAAEGRVVVGLPVDGTLEGTVNTAYTDLEDRDHLHRVNPPKTFTTVKGQHRHTIPLKTKTSAVAGDHKHTVDPALSETDVIGVHEHAVDVAPTPDPSVPSQAGFESLAAAAQSHGHMGTAAEDGAHSHAFDLPSADTSTSATHSHKLSATNVKSRFAGNHRHSVDILTFSSRKSSSGLATLQLLACEKD